MADTTSSSPNADARGNVRLEIAGEPRVLSLTLAALAEMEAGLEVEGFAALGEALGKLNADRLVCVLTALLRAGGATQAEELARQADPMLTAHAVASCFQANLK